MMGRMTAYDQNGRMLSDFDKSDYDFLIRYGRMPEEVFEESAKLLWLVNDMLACFRIGLERNGVSRQWCYELFDSYTSKLRELGIEVKA